MHLLSVIKLKVLIRHLLISQEIFCWTQVTRKNLCVFPIIIPYGSPTKQRIYCLVVFLTYSGMEQDVNTNVFKYGVWESTSSMKLLKRIILVIYHIEVISWDMQLLQESFSTENHIKLLLYTEPTTFGLMNITILFPYNTITP